MTSQEIKYQRIMEALRKWAPEGRNVEYDMKRVAEVLAEDTRAGREPQATRQRITPVLGLQLDYPEPFDSSDLLKSVHTLKAVQTRELYVTALWTAVGDYILWACDTAAQHRMALAMLQKAEPPAMMPGQESYTDDERAQLQSLVKGASEFQEQVAPAEVDELERGTPWHDGWAKSVSAKMSAGKEQAPAAHMVTIDGWCWTCMKPSGEGCTVKAGHVVGEQGE
jgi:hypothetical protein